MSLKAGARLNPNLPNGLEFPNISHLKDRQLSDESLLDEKQTAGGLVGMHKKGVYV